MKAAVSDHALLRYLERVKGIDVEAARAEILTPHNVFLIETLMHAKIPMGNGHRLVVRDRTVVTIL